MQSVKNLQFLKRITWDFGKGDVGLGRQGPYLVVNALLHERSR